MGNWQNKDEPNQNKQNKSFVIKINYEGKTSNLKLFEDLTIEDIIKKFVHNSQNCILKVNGRECFLRKKISYYEEEIKDNIIFYLIDKNENENIDINDFEEEEEEEIDYENIIIDKGKIQQESYEEDNNFNMEINIEFFFKDKNNNFNKNKNNNNKELKGLLKLCLLKKISQTDEFKIENKNENINNLPKKIIDIITILQTGKIDYNNAQEGILRILEKIKGGNIINFSRYVDELISQKEINDYLLSKLNKSKKKINYIYNCLGK